MSPLEAAAAFAVVLAVVVVGFVALETYNAVVALIQRIDKAWANVEVALEQRHDQLPNLVEAVRDTLAWERDVLDAVTRARAAFAPSDPVPRQATTSEATSAAVRSLLAVVERYPELRSQANVLGLQDEIERLEGMIADRRELYNDQVYRYNTRIAQLPAALVAGLLGWRPRPFFRADPSASAAPSAFLGPDTLEQEAAGREAPAPDATIPDA